MATVVLLLLKLSFFLKVFIRILHVYSNNKLAMIGQFGKMYCSLNFIVSSPAQFDYQENKKNKSKLPSIILLINHLCLHHFQLHCGKLPTHILH